MLRRVLYIIIICGFCVDSAKSQSHYLQGTVIIKYKSDVQLNHIAAKKRVGSQQNLQQILQRIGITENRPILQSRAIPSALQNTSAQIQGAISNLRRIYIITYTAAVDPAILSAKISRLPTIEYAAPQFLRKTTFLPNDATLNPYTSYHHFQQAWNVTKGSTDVVIAINGSGVNYLHEDLDAKLWVNTDEITPALRVQLDKNGDGIITGNEVRQYLNLQNGDYNNDGVITLEDAIAPNSPLIDGSDTDGNGYVDDVFGWDFWESGGTQGQPRVGDNNPIMSGSDHGTHVAGIAAAETNNGIGIAGTGFNVRYMAVKTGGIPDDPSTSDNESRQIGFGFEGIIYAAIEGADVINCSWGGKGFSDFEKDVINFATDLGAVVVASAGNKNDDEVIFPAGYQNAVAVGSIETSDVLASYSNYGYALDVLATGSDILSTGSGNSYIEKTGTSMSAPVVSGLAGLIASIHPDWSARRIVSQIRTTATFINTGAIPQKQLGHGKVNAYAAVTANMPGLRILSSNFTDASGQKLGIDEAGFLNLTVVNNGALINGVSVNLESLNDGGISLQQTQRTVGPLATDEKTTLKFDLSINGDYDLSQSPVFSLNFSNPARGYRDFDNIRYEGIFYDIMDANNIKMAFGSAGSVGFTKPLQGRGGVGFIPKPISGSFEDGKNLLFGGGLMVSVNGTMFDAVRGPLGGILKEFRRKNVFKVTNENTTANQVGKAAFEFGTYILGNVTLTVYAFDDEKRSNVIYVKYEINNPTASPFKNVYVGLYNDWDLGENAANNSAKYSEPDSIMYIMDADPASHLPLVAVAHLGVSSGLRAIDNRGGQDFVNPSDGFSDAEKLEAMNAGKSHTSELNTDVSAVVATGPYTIKPKATLVTSFLYAFGKDLDQLRSQIAYARKHAPFAVSAPGEVYNGIIPETTRLYQNYPNPFINQTTIRLDLKEPANVTLQLFDVLGRRVKILKKGKLDANIYIIPFKPEGLSSGVYFLQLITDNKVKVMPMTYIK